jgi:hypothetical protein
MSFAESRFSLLFVGFIDLARVTKFPRIFCKRDCLIQDLLQSWFPSKALLPDFLQAMGLSKWNIMPG